MITSSTTTVTFPEDDPGIWIPKEGEFYRTLSQNSSDNSSSIDKKRAYLYQLKKNEASKILSFCQKPNLPGRSTILVYGKVQSGKTHTMLATTAMAFDNDIKLIIVLTGTKVNLLNQTVRRFVDDLELGQRLNSRISTFTAGECKAEDISKSLNRNVPVIIFSLKQVERLSQLCNLFKNPENSESTDLLKKIGNGSVIIFNDESDQVSVNQFAQNNLKNNTDKKSPNFEKVSQLFESFDSCSLILVTATPQANVLSDKKCLLAPASIKIVEPGEGYIGGQELFGNPEIRSLYFRTIPDADIKGLQIRNQKSHQLSQSLQSAILVYILGCLSLLHSAKNNPALTNDKDERFRTMLVHTKTTKYFHEFFKKAIDLWLEKIENLSKNQMLLTLEPIFRAAYSDLIKTEPSLVSLKDLLPFLSEFFRCHRTHQFSGGSGESFVQDSTALPFNILVGAYRMDRGITFEGLTVTYVNRTLGGKTQDDSLQQRCRFFGYRKKLLPITRIYGQSNFADILTSYAVTENKWREELQKYEGIRGGLKKYMFNYLASPKSRPTRSAVIGQPINSISVLLSHWHYCAKPDPGKKDKQDINIKIFKSLLCDIESNVKTIKELFPKVVISAELLTKMTVYDIELSNVQHFLQEFNYETNDDAVYINALVSKIQQLNIRVALVFLPEAERAKSSGFHQGRSPDGGVIYSGDNTLQRDDYLTIQIRYLVRTDFSPQSDPMLWMAVKPPTNLGDGHILWVADESNA